METEKNNFKVNNLEKESSQLKLLDKNGPCMNEKRPVIVKSNKETRPLSLFQKVGFFFALIGLILLITFVIILAPILQDKTELNANLSTMSSLVQASRNESNNLREENSKLQHDLNTCKNMYHETSNSLQNKTSDLVSLTLQKETFKLKVKSLERQISTKNSQMEILKKEISDLEIDLRSCHGQHNETSQLLQNKTATLVSYGLEKRNLQSKIETLEREMAQISNKNTEISSENLKIASLQQKLMEKNDESKKQLVTCSVELEKEKLSKLDCHNSVRKEQDKVNEALHLKIQLLEKQLEDLKAAVVMKTTEASVGVEAVVLSRTTESTPITKITNTLGYFSRMFSAGSQLMPSHYLFGLHIALISLMKFVF